MNTRSVKQLLVGLVIILFSLMLVFAGLVFAFLDFAYHASNNSYFDTGPTLMVWLALIVGVVGLAVAYIGFSEKD
ncbi:MAG TPA: hypothetical protein VF040_10645 [Ktedonobacterales bacterium]